jgi:CubicO group peptidase (beta-lactamase class C family)
MRIITRVFLIVTFLSLPLNAQQHPLPAQMDKIASAVYKPNVPGAAVIVVKNGRVIFRKGYGLANLELHTPMRPEMVFRLASVTKQFTAAAIMMLIEQGKLSLTDDIAKFFPAYKGKNIMVGNLLTHTSGISDYLLKLWPDRMREDMGPKRIAELFQNEPLEFEPGTKGSYSNSNYVLLGLIIEQLSGQTYGDFIEQNIFKPLGMKHSCYEIVQQIIPDRVSGYAKTEHGYVNAAYFSMPQLYAAGALDSSVDDLALWDASIYSNKLLKQASWERIFTPHKFKNGESGAYASGWAIGQFQGRLIESHEGGVPGFTTYVLRLPQDHVYVAILANDRTMETQPEFVARRLAAIAIGKPIVDEKIVKLDAAKLAAYGGVYHSDKDGDVNVRTESGRLLFQSQNDPEVELFPLAKDKFIIKAFDARVSFVKDATGNISTLTIQVGDDKGEFKKVK